MLQPDAVRLFGAALPVLFRRLRDSPRCLRPLPQVRQIQEVSAAQADIVFLLRNRPQDGQHLLRGLPVVLQGKYQLPSLHPQPARQVGFSGRHSPEIPAEIDLAQGLEQPDPLRDKTQYALLAAQAHIAVAHAEARLVQAVQHLLLRLGIPEKQLVPHPPRPCLLRRRKGVNLHLAIPEGDPGGHLAATAVEIDPGQQRLPHHPALQCVAEFHGARQAQGRNQLPCRTFRRRFVVGKGAASVCPIVQQQREDPPLGGLCGTCFTFPEDIPAVLRQGKNVCGKVGVHRQPAAVFGYLEAQRQCALLNAGNHALLISGQAKGDVLQQPQKRPGCAVRQWKPLGPGSGRHGAADAEGLVDVCQQLDHRLHLFLRLEIGHVQGQALAEAQLPAIPHGLEKGLHGANHIESVPSDPKPRLQCRFGCVRRRLHAEHQLRPDRRLLNHQIHCIQQQGAQTAFMPLKQHMQ